MVFTAFKSVCIRLLEAGCCFLNGLRTGSRRNTANVFIGYCLSTEFSVPTILVALSLSDTRVGTTVESVLESSRCYNICAQSCLHLS
jgi:hypothetical protein